MTADQLLGVLSLVAAIVVLVVGVLLAIALRRWRIAAVLGGFMGVTAATFAVRLLPTDWSVPYLVALRVLSIILALGLAFELFLELRARRPLDK